MPDKPARETMIDRLLGLFSRGKCRFCEERGNGKCAKCYGLGYTVTNQPCGTCQGSGKCVYCKGTGTSF
jgi:hypothetical protein